jgi:hypothetical protein
MDAGMTPEQRKAFEAAMLRVHELEGELERVEAARNVAAQSGDVSAQIDASGAVIRTSEALQRAWLDAGRCGGELGLVPSQADIARDQLAFRQQLREHLPVALDSLIDVAFLDDSTDPDMPQVRADAKRVLLQTDLVTEHELATFPKESLKTIVAERYREWVAET